MWLSVNVLPVSESGCTPRPSPSSTVAIQLELTESVKEPAWTNAKPSETDALVGSEMTGGAKGTLNVHVLLDEVELRTSSTTSPLEKMTRVVTQGSGVAVPLFAEQSGNLAPLAKT